MSKSTNKRLLFIQLINQTSDITYWLISDLGTRSLTRKLGWELCLERISAPELDRLTDSRNTVPPVSWGEGGPPQVT